MASIRRIISSIARAEKRVAKCGEELPTLSAPHFPDPRSESLERIGFHGEELKNFLVWSSAANAAHGVDVDARLREVSSALVDLRVDQKVWATIVTQHKRWLFVGDGDEFQRNLANLCSLVRSFQRFKVDLSKWIIQMRPSDEETLEETTKFLLDQAGSEKIFRKVVQCVPMVLQFDVEKNLKPRIDTMIALGFTKEQITKVVSLFPCILTVTPDRLTALVTYLTEDLGFSSDQACRIITVFPSLSRLSLEVISSKVDYFVSCGMDRSKVRSMLRKNPVLLGSSIEKSVKPKMEFLGRKIAYYKRVMKQPLSSLCRFSALLTFSMEDKVVPRTMFRQWLLLNGIARRELSQAYLIVLSKDAFAKRFLRESAAVEAYNGFLESARR